MTHPFHEIQHGYNHSNNAPGANPKGDDWCNRPPKTHKSNSIHHDFIQFSKQHSWYKAILLSSVSSQKCCEVYFIYLLQQWTSNDTWLPNFTDIAPPPNLYGLYPSLEPTVFEFPAHHVLPFQTYTFRKLVWALAFVCTGHWNF